MTGLHQISAARGGVPAAPRAANRGAVLVIGLIVLLVMAMLGIASVRTSNLEELMAGHSKDSNSAFQAAESAMSAALAYLAGFEQLPPGIPRVACRTFVEPALCPADSTDACCSFRNVIAAWQAYPSATVTTLAGRAISDLPGADWVGTPAPHFVIEYRCANRAGRDTVEFGAVARGRGCYGYFTIATVGFDPNTNSRAILQTTVQHDLSH